MITLLLAMDTSGSKEDCVARLVQWVSARRKLATAYILIVGMFYNYLSAMRLGVWHAAKPASVVYLQVYLLPRLLNERHGLAGRGNHTSLVKNGILLLRKLT